LPVPEILETQNDFLKGRHGEASLGTKRKHFTWFPGTGLARPDVEKLPLPGWLAAAHASGRPMIALKEAGGSASNVAVCQGNCENRASGGFPVSGRTKIADGG